MAAGAGAESAMRDLRGRVAEDLEVSVKTVKKWLIRFRAAGPDGLHSGRTSTHRGTVGP